MGVQPPIDALANYGQCKGNGGSSGRQYDLNRGKGLGSYPSRPTIWCRPYLEDAVSWDVHDARL